MIDLGAINNQDSILCLIMPIGFEYIVLFIHLSTFAPKNEFIGGLALAAKFLGFFIAWVVEVDFNIINFPYDFVLVSIVRRLRLFICIEAFVVFIEIQLGYTPLKVKWFFKWRLWWFFIDYLRLALGCIFIEFLSKMPLKDSLLFLFLKIIDHVLESKLGLSKAHVLHSCDLVILVLGIL